MTYTMLDHLRVLNDVLTGSGVVLALGGSVRLFQVARRSHAGYRAPLPA